MCRIGVSRSFGTAMTLPVSESVLVSVSILAANAGVSTHANEYFMYQMCVKACESSLHECSIHIDGNINITVLMSMVTSTTVLSLMMNTIARHHCIHLHRSRLE